MMSYARESRRKPCLLSLPKIIVGLSSGFLPDELHARICPSNTQHGFLCFLPIHVTSLTPVYTGLYESSVTGLSLKIAEFCHCVLSLGGTNLEDYRYIGTMRGKGSVHPSANGLDRRLPVAGIPLRQSFQTRRACKYRFHGGEGAPS